MRTSHFWPLLLLAAFALTLLPTARSHAGGATSPGNIIITEHPLNPHASSFTQDLKSEARSTLARDGDNWKVYFIAYLKKAAGAEPINVVFYEQSPQGKAKAVQRTHEPVNAYPIHTQPGAKILMSDVELKPADGFKPGGKYQVLITRLLADGKEDVFARTTVELK